MDVAISPRATFYASPMKLLEYMAMAKPIIAPRMPNIQDFLTDKETAILFEPNKPASLASAIETLLGSPPLADRLGQAARASIEREFNWRNNADRVVQIARQIQS